MVCLTRLSWRFGAERSCSAYCGNGINFLPTGRSSNLPNGIVRSAGVKVAVTLIVPALARLHFTIRPSTGSKMEPQRRDPLAFGSIGSMRSEEHTSELQSLRH